MNSRLNKSIPLSSSSGWAMQDQSEEKEMEDALIIDWMTADEWNELMELLDEVEFEHHDAVDYQEPPLEVLIGEYVQEWGLSPFFSRAEAKVIMEELNPFLENELDLDDVLHIFNLELTDYQANIRISPRKQRYVLTILFALWQSLEEDQRHAFLQAALILFNIDPGTFKTEISKINHSNEPNHEYVVKHDVLALYDRFVDRLRNTRTPQRP